MVRLNYWKRVLLFIIVVLIGCAGVSQAKPKNVIFLIGDGMGPEQVKAAGIYAYGAPGTLSFESFPYQGRLTTYSADSSITDSAAAATALATGFRVNNGVISMAYPGNGSELETLLEYYKSLYKSTGLVSTSYLTDATPGAFGAHEPTRSNTSAIAGDYLNQTQPNVLLGGGGNGMTTSEFASAGYTVVTDRASMLALTTESVTKVSGQFGSGQMRYEFDGLENQPHLSEMTATALNILDNDTDGFFLMVEGGNIDHACHSSDLARTIPEVSEFADAVQVAINWAAGRNDTLILVAADHETGGLTVTANNGAGVLPGVTWGGAGGHTAANVPVYAWGVNAELISGVMDNTSTFGVVVSDEPIELVSPAYHAVSVSTSPNLEVRVRDPDGTGDPLDVTFFGRENPSFTIVVLPDTQKYVLNGAYPQIFTSQTQWIVDNAVSENIVFMTHEGDIVDTWNNTTEWGYANDSISLLDGVVPYGLGVGNHDKFTDNTQGTYPDYPTDSTYFNQTFPYTRYQGEPWYGGHYPNNANDNNYQLFSAGGDNYIILHLEDTPKTADISWADSVLKANADRRAIITTHSYLDGSGNYNGKWGSTQYIRNLVTANDNVYFVLCGHLSTELTKTTTVNGRLVHEMIADYQGRANGGDGWLRILRFEPDEDKVYVRTYSTWHDAYEADSGSQFTLDFPMSSSAFTAIGTNSGVASGASTSLTWPGRKIETQYEWYVTVTDSTPPTTVGPVWSFATGSPKASNPSPADGAADVDTNADLSWSAGVDAVRHDVYFGMDAGNLPLVSPQQAGTTYDPGLLQLDTTYYWAIDEHNSVGGITYGDVWSFTTAPPAPLTFQQGVNGYMGMVDTMIRSPAPTTNYANSAVNYDSGYQYQYNADTSTGSPAGPSHVLLRFNGIIGGSPGQIPAGSTILSATLRLRTMDASNGGKLHRLLQSWTATTVTWANSFGGNGIQADGSEAAVSQDDGVASTSGAGDTDLNVTATVQGYVDGTITNKGWALLPNGSDGWHIAAAEHPTVDYRPELIVSFTPPQNQPAGNPNPADGATQAAVDADLGWTAGTGAVSHDVYFGTAQPPTFVQNQTATTFDPGLLLPNTTYYWQIDERDSVGGVVTGAVWSFTTTAAPTQASAPSPVNGAAGVGIDADLTWTAGSGTTSHQVYFGTGSDPRVNTPVNQAESTYDPGILNAATAYYWAVDEVGPGGTAAGEIWSFTTAAVPGLANSPTPPDMLEDVSVDVVLSWTAGADATSHDVYLGTEAASLPQVSAGQTGTSYDQASLESGTTYYWRVDETGPGGTTTGTVWSFTTGYPAPGQAANPNPPSPSSDVSADVVLSWTPGSDTTSHDVYFGTDADPRVNTPVNQAAGAVFDPPGLLQPETTYYWAIDEVGPGGTTSGEVWTFTTKANQAPTANAGVDQAVSDSDGTGSETVALNGSGSDTDGTIASYEWKEGANVLGNTAAITPDLAVGVHTITLTVTDNGGATGTDDVIVTVNANQPPTANAGTDQAVSDSDGTGSETVTLNGSGSDTDGTIASYEWKEGTNVLGNTAAIAPDLAVGVHTITLTVTDNGGATGTDDVIVTVNANQPPTANAGTDQAVSDSDGTGSETVTLNGSGSDADGTIASYQWKEGANILGNTATITPDLAVGVHTITLTVTDNGGATGSDNVVVTVNANQPPTANAGTDQAVSDSDGTGSETVTLNGSGSDTDGTIASYQWKEGANVLGNTAAIAPDLAVGVHTITLTVTDNGGATGTDDVVVTVNANQPPTANAGTDQTVTDSDHSGRESVTLSGSGADADGTIVAYEWKENTTTLGTGPSITVDLAVGVHTITLTVTDNGGAPGSDNVIVTVEEGPAAIDDTANSDISVSGTITSGSYVSTAGSDNVYEAIREIRQGTTSTGRSLLEHKWTINVTGGSAVSFHVEAYRTANSEGDNFVFAYSTDNLTYTNLLTVTKTADNNTLQSAILPSTLSGTVYVRVQDTDQTKGRTGLDTIYIDQMFIRSQGFGPDTSPPSPNPMTWSAAPHATSSTSVSMTATTAFDPSGVEYYFDCLTAGGHDSGWQSSTSYEDTGLSPNTTYTYTVTARDLSANHNQTAASTAESATTNPAPEWTGLTYDDFETGWGNYTDGGGDCSLYAAGTYAHQGSSAADVQDNSGTASSFFYTNGVDVHTPGYTQIKVEFWFYAVSMETGEDFWLQYYDGSAWRTVKAWASGADFNNGTFYNPVVYINEASYTLPTNMKIRFMCDASDNDDDVYIDEVRVSAK